MIKKTVQKKSVTTGIDRIKEKDTEYRHAIAMSLDIIQSKKKKK